MVKDGKRQAGHASGNAAQGRDQSADAQARNAVDKRSDSLRESLRENCKPLARATKLLPAVGIVTDPGFLCKGSRRDMRAPQIANRCYLPSSAVCLSHAACAPTFTAS